MSSPNTRSVSVSIVSYNTREHTLACIGSVLASRGPVTVDVTVVDNASSDGTADAIAQHFPNVRLIRNASNRYFTGAHNQALRDATGDLVLILNSDTVLSPTVIAGMAEFMEAHPGVGAATCLYVDQHGHPLRAHLHNYWRFHSLWYTALARHGAGVRLYRLLGGRIEGEDRQPSMPVAYVDVVSDAFVMIRRQALRQFGGYDERMLLYFTEDDICRQLARTGWRIAVNRQVTITHHMSSSVKKIPALSMRRIYRNDSIVYYRKYGTWLERLVAWPLLYLTYLAEATVLTLGYRMKFRG